jgi:hypothetical protein
MKSTNVDEKEILDTIAPDLWESEKVYRAVIRGRPPGILMHNIEGMMKQLKGGSVRRRNQKPTYEEDAENSAYRMENGELYIPAKAIFGSIVHAGMGMKFGKFAAKSILATIRVFPERIPLGTKDYEIDVQSVVVQHARIPRARPLIKEWSITFYIVFDTNFMKAEDLQTVIHDAGKRVGIHDFRPEHLGQYGQFRLETFEEVKA